MDRQDEDRKEIAYVIMGFPRLSETFISNEILQLETLGARLRVFAVKHGGDSVAARNGRRNQGADRVSATRRLPVGYRAWNLAAAELAAISRSAPQAAARAAVRLPARAGRRAGHVSALPPAAVWRAAQGLHQGVPAGRFCG